MFTSSSQVFIHCQLDSLAYIKEEVKTFTREVPILGWVHSALQLDEERLKTWTDTISKANWANDPVIRAAMDEFKAATCKPERYESFRTIANCVLELARNSNLPGKAYPLTDITFHVNDETDSEQFIDDPEMKQCSPDILCVRKSAGDEDWWWCALMTIELEFLEEEASKSKTSTKTAKKGQSRPSSPQSRWARTQSIPSTSKPSTRTKHVRDADDDEGPSSKQSHPHAYAGPISPTDAHATYRAANNALEMLTGSHGARIHCFNWVLDDYNLIFWYYDASGIVKSKESWHFVNNFDKVAAAFVALACCDPSQFGAFPCFEPPATNPHPLGFPTSSLSHHTISLPPSDEEHPGQEVVFELLEHIYTQYSLIGRQTSVYQARVHSSSGPEDQELVVKVSQPARTKAAEWTFVKVAKAAGVQHLPQILACAEFLGSRHREGSIRKRLHDIFSALDEDSVYEDRAIRVLAMRRYLPLRERLAVHPEDIKLMVNQMIDCLHDLRYKAHILHRDVSFSNIMFDLDSQASKPMFILNDFDLAVKLREDGNIEGLTALQQTGTLPFMAVQLLEWMDQPPSKVDKRCLHRLRHDFESLYWVTLWSMMKSEPPFSDKHRARIKAEVADWEDRVPSLIAGSKFALLTTRRFVTELPFTSTYSKPEFSQWLVAFHSVFALAKSLTLNDSDIVKVNNIMDTIITKQAFQVSFDMFEKDLSVLELSPFRLLEPLGLSVGDFLGLSL